MLRCTRGPENRALNSTASADGLVLRPDFWRVSLSLCAKLWRASCLWKGAGAGIQGFVTSGYRRAATRYQVSIRIRATYLS